MRSIAAKLEDIWAIIFLQEVDQKSCEWNRFYEESELRLIHLKVCGGIWASTHSQGGAPFIIDWSFEHQFNSSSSTLSETIGKLVLLMWGVGTFWGAAITDKTTKLKIRIPIWPTVAQLQQQNGTMCHFFWNQKKKCLIRLHSSAFIYTRLHLSTLV